MVIACFASIAPRRAALQRALSSILPQVDRVFVYLNGAAQPWPEMDHPKITWAFSRAEGWKGSEAKFWWSDASKFRHLELAGVDAYFCCDDDILYPRDYVQKMREALGRHPEDLVGVHGVRIREPVTGYHQSINVFAGFRVGLKWDTQVHLLGTGTVAFAPAAWAGLLSFDSFPVPNMADLWLALCARQAGRKLWAVRRPQMWLRALPTHGYSVSAAKSQGRDLAETELVQMHSPWPPL